ncbi:twin-arginine translocase TatA/TatE family subunit [Acidocella sp.]|jgi:sec-independent protein translocase protein TatA|uniref:twin-arginine translocase TatA/TatE family subunit n=1 Tax=Acidocella sp. TaxID=50710 RepID=UPI0026237A23|nr:twin-arginine translocase TatA/TatE family subunit [Acidocella sp.]
MGGLSIWHWLVVLVVVLLVFGTGKVSNLMGEFGKGIKNFKQAINEDDTKKDASMSESAKLDAPAQAPDSVNKTNINQG